VAINTAQKTRKSTPHRAACRCAPCIHLKLDEASWRLRDRIPRQIVNSLSLDELRLLPPETRRRLQAVLSDGHVSKADKRAIDKIQLAELVQCEYQRRLIIKGAPEFVENTKAHLDSIAETSIGQRLLRSLSRSGKVVTIIPASRVSEAPPCDYRGALAKGKALRWRSQSGKLRSIRGNGSGSDTTIKYNPDRTRLGSSEAWQSQPPGIWLAHELIHADDAAYGRMDPEEVDGLRNFERQAIGLPPYEQKEFTENKFRAEWQEQQPARPRY